MKKLALFTFALLGITFIGYLYVGENQTTEEFTSTGSALPSTEAIKTTTSVARQLGNDVNKKEIILAEIYDKCLGVVDIDCLEAAGRAFEQLRLTEYAPTFGEIFSNVDKKVRNVQLAFENPECQVGEDILYQPEKAELCHANEIAQLAYLETCKVHNPEGKYGRKKAQLENKQLADNEAYWEEDKRLTWSYLKDLWQNDQCKKLSLPTINIAEYYEMAARLGDPWARSKFSQYANTISYIDRDSATPEILLANKEDTRATLALMLTDDPVSILPQQVYMDIQALDSQDLAKNVLDIADEYRRGHNGKIDPELSKAEASALKSLDTPSQLHRRYHDAYVKLLAFHKLANENDITYYEWATKNLERYRPSGYNINDETLAELDAEKLLAGL